MPAWSHTIHASWPSELRFFEERTALLRRLEDAQSLIAFRWAEEVLSVRVGRTEVVEMTANGVLGIAVSPDADLGRLRGAIQIVIDTLRPASLALQELLLQYVIPLDEAYAAARRSSAVLLLGELLPGASLTDWSVLSDGFSENVGALFQMEFGVIDDQEAPERISRRLGRVQHRIAVSLPVDFYDYEDYPGCALFLDWRWIPRGGRTTVSDSKSLFDLWDRVVKESDGLSEAVRDRTGLTAVTQMEAGA